MVEAEQHVGEAVAGGAPGAHGPENGPILARRGAATGPHTPPPLEHDMVTRVRWLSVRPRARPAILTPREGWASRTAERCSGRYIVKLQEIRILFRRTAGWLSRFLAYSVRLTQPVLSRLRIP